MKKLCCDYIRNTGSQKMTVFHGRKNDKKQISFRKKPRKFSGEGFFPKEFCYE